MRSAKIQVPTARTIKKDVQKKKKFPRVLAWCMAGGGQPAWKHDQKLAGKIALVNFGSKLFKQEEFQNKLKVVGLYAQHDHYTERVYESIVT